VPEYVTTNIRLPKELYRELKRRALDEQKSLAEVVRESVLEYLVGTKAEGKELPTGTLREEENDPLWLIGTDPVVADVTEGSLDHDLHLYGGPVRSSGTRIRD
jgi:Ribbon-helix-helix protein, copG family